MKFPVLDNKTVSSLFRHVILSVVDVDPGTVFNKVVRWSFFIVDNDLDKIIVLFFMATLLCLLYFVWSFTTLRVPSVGHGQFRVKNSYTFRATTLLITNASI